jgi:hypothetical protein
MLACHKIRFSIRFSKCRQEEYPLVWKYVEDKHWIKDYSKAKIDLLFPQNYWIVFEEVVKSLAKDELTVQSPGYLMWCVGCNKNSYSEKNWLQFGKKFVSELKKLPQKKSVKLNSTFAIFLLEL